MPNRVVIDPTKDRSGRKEGVVRYIARACRHLIHRQLPPPENPHKKTPVPRDTLLVNPRDARLFERRFAARPTSKIPARVAARRLVSATKSSIGAPAATT